MTKIKKSGPYNPQKAEAYVGKGVLKYGDTIPAIKKAITPVPNGPLIKKKGPFKGSSLKNGGKLKVKAGGENHVVYKAKKDSPKGKKGDVMVNHPTMDKGKWDTINLSKIGKAKTVKQGAAATRKWHEAHPDYKYKGKKK